MFKQLFCKHRDLEHVKDIHGDQINALDCRSIWKCKKCGKFFYSKILHHCYEQGRTVDDIKELLKNGMRVDLAFPETEKISDGYHTFEGLYHQRTVLFATICNMPGIDSWKSYRHYDGKLCFDGSGWFIAGINTPDGMYTYHCENKYWDMFKCAELENAPEWDGHTEKDVERLLSLGFPSKGKDEWAEHEVDLAIKRETEDDLEDPLNGYVISVYKSALKAYYSLLQDGHSGTSIGFTKNILNKLIEHKALSPIEDIPEVWNECDYVKREYKTYQCKRMPSLFKDVYPDGKVEYHDGDRVVCFDERSSFGYSNGLIDKIIHERFPITFPYVPCNKPYQVYCETFLTDPENGDYDTQGILYVITPEGDKVDIGIYLKDASNGMEEISKEEYEERKLKQVKRK